MAVAGREGPERVVGCPVDAPDAFDTSLKSVALICVLLSAFSTVFYRVFTFPTKHAVLSRCCSCYSPEPTAMVITFTILAGNLRMKPVCGVVLFPHFLQGLAVTCRVATPAIRCCK